MPDAIVNTIAFMPERAMARKVLGAVTVHLTDLELLDPLVLMHKGRLLI